MDECLNIRQIIILDSVVYNHFVVVLLNERRERARTRPHVDQTEYKTDTNLAVFPALSWLCLARCSWVYPSLSNQSDLSSLKDFRAVLMLETPWCCHVGLPGHVISAEKDSRAATEAPRTWRPSLTDVFRLRRCSLSRLGGTGPKR